VGKLPKYFYQREDVLVIAEELLGKLLVTRFEGKLTSGRITETEAYAGVNDRASHAFGGRLTKRTAPMFEAGGISYVYLCHGIHHLFNVVTHQKGTPHAVLIRAVEPVEGIGIMQQRIPASAPATLGRGPGKLSRALGIRTLHTGMSLQSKELFIYDDGFSYSKSQIQRSPRIGVDYAGEDALLPYRLFVSSK
jgi:DNA-3-methyladenine glycosylase